MNRTAQNPEKAPNSYTLKAPVLVDGNQYTSLTFQRRPKAADSKAVAHLPDSLSREIALLANLCGVSVDVIDELDWDIDYPGLLECYVDFLALTAPQPSVPTPELSAGNS